MHRKHAELVWFTASIYSPTTILIGPHAAILMLTQGQNSPLKVKLATYFASKQCVISFLTWRRGYTSHWPKADVSVELCWCSTIHHCYESESCKLHEIRRSNLGPIASHFSIQCETESARALELIQETGRRPTGLNSLHRFFTLKHLRRLKNPFFPSIRWPTPSNSCSD
jgi:hypothetical protein